MGAGRASGEGQPVALCVGTALCSMISHRRRSILINFAGELDLKITEIEERPV